MQAMEYTDMSGKDISELLVHDGWVAQQKYDGTRVLIDLQTGDALTRKGTPLKFAAANQHLDSIRADLKRVGLLGKRNVYLDGEMIVESGTYYLFDMFDPTDRKMTYQDRLAWLHSLSLSGTNIKIVATWWGDSKIKALSLLRNAGVEGMMLKRLDSLYEMGTRVTSCHKFKFVKSADVIVTETKTSPMSASFAVYGDDGVLVPVGACSMIGKPNVERGDVIEVNYLFWTGSNLYQPRMMRRRTDKAARDCRLDQLPTYSREEVMPA